MKIIDAITEEVLAENLTPAQAQEKKAELEAQGKKVIIKLR